MNKRLRVCIGVILALAFVLSIPAALAAPDDTVTIPDAALRQRLLELADADSSGSLTEGERAALDSLDLSGLGISDITGLQHLTGITELNLSNNNLQDISVLQHLLGLEKLNLSGNNITNISVLKQLISLTELNVSVNYLDTSAGSAAMAAIEEIRKFCPGVDFSAQKPISVSGVTLSASSLLLCTGEAHTLTATVAPSGAANKAVTWQSSNASVATVSDGTVTAVAPGQAIITATTQDGNKAVTCTVTVKSTVLSSSYYKIGNGQISGLTKQTKPSQFLGRVIADADNLRLLSADGNVFSGDTLATGMHVQLHIGGSLRDSLAIAVGGDTNGDGQITITDYTLTRLDILGLKQLEGIFRTAADANYDGQVTITDYTLIRLDILGLKPIGGYVPPDLPAVSDARIRRFLDVALAQQGKPYVWGAVGPGSFDCSGYVYYCLNQAGYKVGRTTANSYSNYSQWPYVEKDQLQPGDLMFYKDDNDPNRIGHIGIYLGNGYHIHASSSFECVIICRVDGWYERMLTHGRRVFN